MKLCSAMLMVAVLLFMGFTSAAHAGLAPHHASHSHQSAHDHESAEKTSSKAEQAQCEAACHVPQVSSFVSVTGKSVAVTAMVIPAASTAPVSHLSATPDQPPRIA